MKEETKRLSTFSGIALGMSMVVGTGILSLGGMALETGGPRAATLGWALAALAIIPFLFIFSKIGLRTKGEGGFIKCIEEALGKGIGRGAKTVLFCNYLLIIPSTALVGAIYLQKFLNLPEIPVSLLAFGILSVATLLNSLGSCKMGWVSKVSLLVLICLLLSLVIANPHFIKMGVRISLDPNFSNSVSFGDIWKIATLVIFAFLGFENLSFLSQEFKNPKRSIPLSYLFGFLLVALLYLSLALLVGGAHVMGLPTSGASGLAVLLKQFPYGSLLLGSIGIVSLANVTSWIYSAKKNAPCRSFFLLFTTYSFVILAFHLFHLSLSFLFLLATQGFLIVYLLSILAYWKMETRFRWILTPLAIVSSTFLLSGASWYVLCPLTIFCLSTLKDWRYPKRDWAIDYTQANRWFKIDFHLSLKQLTRGV